MFDDEDVDEIMDHQKVMAFKIRHGITTPRVKPLLTAPPEDVDGTLQKECDWVNS